jgi:Ankyrin repeats (3 copies)
MRKTKPKAHKAAGAALVCLLCLPTSAKAADTVLGVFVAAGRTTTLKNVYVTLDHNSSGDEEYQTILVSNIPIEPADRTPARLKALADQGKVRALRIIWRAGYDSVLAVPYDKTLAESGLAVRERPTINFMRLDERRIEVRIRSKMIGQAWHYDATIKADIKAGGVLETEPMADAPSARTPLPSGPAGGRADEERRLKMQLGALGFEYSDDSFRRAIVDGHLEALKLFLTLGKTPNARDRSGEPLLILATSFCGSRPGPNRTAVILALIGAGADVKVKNSIDGTALLDAAQYRCDLEVARALLKAGADPNAKSRGGSTPLWWATYNKQDDLVSLLKSAGARETP